MPRNPLVEEAQEHGPPRGLAEDGVDGPIRAAQSCPIYGNVIVNRCELFFDADRVGASTSGCGLNHLFGISRILPSP